MAWTANKNDNFAARIQRMAVGLEDLRREADQLEKLWFAENVQGSVAFKAVGDLTTAEMQTMIIVCQDLLKFMDNIAVTTDARRTYCLRVTSAIRS